MGLPDSDSFSETNDLKKPISESKFLIVPRAPAVEDDDRLLYHCHQDRQPKDDQSTEKGMKRGEEEVAETDEIEEKRPSSPNVASVPPFDLQKLRFPTTSRGDDGEETEDDGFRTPTSMDSRIPKIQQCPPAPKKPISSKRKSRPNSAIRIDLSSEKLDIIYTAEYHGGADKNKINKMVKKSRKGDLGDEIGTLCRQHLKRLR